MIGKTISRYKILQKIGQGGMGEVFLAHDASLDRKVAIKFLPEALKADETARKRFIREARSAAALDHPYICSIHEVGEEEGKSFIVMEYLEGQTLKDRLAKGALPLKEALQRALEIAEALTVAHEKGIIHRDLKPANIMLPRTGHAKVMDFGLAKQVPVLPQSVSQEETLTGGLTREGTTVGTVPYMSPEQVLGKTVDHRSDLFSFGIVIYEMLTGLNPFRKASGFDTAEAIVRDTPVPISNYRNDVPPPVIALVDKLLAKNTEDRYPQAREAATGLQRAMDETFGQQIVITRPAFGGLRTALKKPFFFIPLIIVLAVAAYFSVQKVKSYQKDKWAREVLPKEIEELMAQDRPVAASGRLQELERHAPESRELDRLKTALLMSPVRIETEPPGADIYLRDYPEENDKNPLVWELLGRSPFTSKPLPSGYYRFRVVKEGFEPLEIGAYLLGRAQFRLHSKKEIPEGMVWVSGVTKGGVGPAAKAPVAAAEFWIDKYEVTNRQFKAFVDAGGYQKPEYWKQPFVESGHTLSWTQAMAKFKDRAGRTGPATWVLGNYPEGNADFPVGGISWYEAAAYAEFAGKSLPTVFHWYSAAGIGVSSIILRFSNFAAQGPAEVGAHRGVGSFGAYDMAGNLKEWCWNEIEDRRYILGGAWSEPEYTFRQPDAKTPFDREETFGFRCVKYTESPPKALSDPVPFTTFNLDRSKDKPPDDQAYRIYLDLHSYDKTDLKPAVELVDDTSSQNWRRERITFQSAYGNERVIADLYLPKSFVPPYQVIQFFPGVEIFYFKMMSASTFRIVEFLLRSGRAVMVPHYKYTLERGPMPNWDGRPALVREINLQWSKDLGRSIDYLETRPEIDIEKIAYVGFSLGALIAPHMIGVEPRIKYAVLLQGGAYEKWPAEVDSWNYTSRVRIPILMLNGEKDFVFPLESSQRPLFRLLGTPEKDKELKLFDGGHDIFGRLEALGYMVNWLDRYLGPAKMKQNVATAQK